VADILGLGRSPGDAESGIAKPGAGEPTHRPHSPWIGSNWSDAEGIEPRNRKTNDMPVQRRVPSVHLSGTGRRGTGNEPHAQVAGTIGNAHERRRRSGWSPGMELQEAVLATGGVPSFTEEVQPHAVH
jgi:hypothetical protein